MPVSRSRLPQKMREQRGNRSWNRPIRSPSGVEITVSGAGEITVPVVMAAAMTTSREAMASSRGWRMMSGFMVRRWFCPNADCGFCLRQGAENSSLRPLVGNGRYKSRKKCGRNRNYFGTIYDFYSGSVPGGPELCFERLLSAAPDGIYDSGPVLNREGVQDGFRRSGAIETAV